MRGSLYRSLAYQEVVTTILTGMKDGYRRCQGFLTAEETERWRRRIDEQPELFHAVSARGGLNLRYRVIDGHAAREHLPDLVEWAETRLRQAAEEAVGEDLAPIRDRKRSLRIQLYRGADEGFRWHFDVSPYSALLTLENTVRGATEVISPRLSRLLTPLYFLIYPLRQVFSIVRHRTIVSEPGDLLILHGTGVLHRAKALESDGERLVVVAVFEPVDSQPTPIRNWLARTFNY